MSETTDKGAAGADEQEPEVLEGEIEDPGPGSGDEAGATATEEDEVTDAEPAADEQSEGELATARRERDEYLDLAQRARAELDNYRRRVAGETAKAEQRGRAGVAGELLSAIDNLERALQAAGVDPDGGMPEGEPASREVSGKTALAEGVALVYRELCEGLKRAGVEPFDPSGESFDAATCEAVATADREGAGKGEVVEVLAKGYRVGEQVLRPARVVVSN